MAYYVRLVLGCQSQFAFAQLLPQDFPPHLPVQQFDHSTHQLDLQAEQSHLMIGQDSQWHCHVLL